MYLHVRIELSNRKDASHYASHLADRGWTISPDRDSKANEVTVRLGFPLMADLARDLTEIYRMLPAVNPPVHLIAPVSQDAPRNSHF